MEIKIRKAKLNDLKRIMEIYSRGIIDEFKTQYPKKSNKEIFDYIGEVKKVFRGFDKQIKSKKELWLIAGEGKKIVGFANAKIMDKKSAWLMMNYIIKDYRGKGLGKKLTEERMKWLKENNIKEIYVRTFLKNKASLKNVKKFGFKPTSIIFERLIK